MLLTKETYALAADEWTIVQGMVGYYRILKHAGIKVKVTDEGIVFNPEHLERFEDHYFQFFLDRYSIAKRDERTVRRAFTKFKKANELTKKKDAKGGVQAVKKILDECIKRTAIDKVEKKFIETPATKHLVEIAHNLRNQKVYSEEMDDWIEQYVAALSVSEIDSKLTLNYVKATILGPYFGQVSFLNVLHTPKTVEEQKAIFYKDYIKNVLLDLDLQSVLKSAVSTEEILEYLGASSHELAKSLKTKFKKMRIEQVQEYLSQEVNRCSFFETQWAFDQYSESHFSPLSMSAPKALNFYWGANNTLTIPVSKLAKFILFCAPAGASISGGKSLFVQREGRFEQLIYANNTYDIGRQKEKAFDEILFDLVAEQQTKVKQTEQNYLILEYSSDYSAKKTDLQYFHLTTGLCSLFKSDKCLSLFRQLNYILRNQIVHSFLQYQDPKVLIHNQLRMKLQEKRVANEIVYACLLRHYFRVLVRGEESMSASLETGKKRIWSAYYAGIKMNNELEEGKIRSIAYRLLNAVRANDKKMFLDTTMRLYMSVEKPLPTVFMNVLDETQIDFASVGDSFIAGLITKEEEKKDEQ